jgi:signal transduction histidine kinase
MRRLSRERQLVLAVAVSLSLAVLSFFVSRAIAEVVSRRIQQEAVSISTNAIIATQALTATRTNLGRAAFAMNAVRASDRPEIVDAQAASTIAASRREAAANWAKYLSIPFYPRERELMERAEPAVAGAGLEAEDVGERLRRGDHEGALRAIDGRALPSMGRANEVLERLIQFNAQEAREAGTRILASRRPGGLLPEVIGAIFAVAAACFGIRLLTQYLAWARERSGELEQFAGRVAHDIRSPLGSASLALEIAQRGKDFDPKTRELLGRVSRTMQRIGQLVDGLLVFATSGGYIVPGLAGGGPQTSTSDVLRGVVEDLKLQAETKQVAIEYVAPEPALLLACNPGVLISMAINLVSNALKFMGDAPLRRITLRVREVGPYAEMDVSDTGPGIAPEIRDKIFEPHFRGDTQVPGFGLGLATVRRLAEAHDGTVGVESGPEGGSRFWFRLPIWKEAPRGRAQKTFRSLRTA